MMKQLSVVAILALLVVAASASDVKDLNPDNFDTIIDGSTGAFIEFYAPWCGHCKKLAPEYEVVATAFKRFATKATIAKVDCDSHRELCSRFGVTGYPTLKWFPKDNKAGQDYDRPRVASDLVAFVNEKAKTDRSVDGRLGATAGIIASLKDFVTEFKGATDKAEVATRAVAAANALATPAAKFYARVFEATVADASFVATELTRIERLLSSSSLSAKKIDEFTIRVNILKSFA